METNGTPAINPLHNPTTMNTTAFEALCRVSSRILETPGTSTLIILDFIFGSIALVLNTLLFCAVWKVTLFHANLRLLLAHIAFMCAWYSVALMVKVSSVLRALVANAPCSLITEAYQCKVQEISRSWPSQAIMYACVAVTVERLYCTIRYKRPYGERFPMFGVLLILVCQVVPLYNIVKSLSAGDGYVAVCEALLSSNAAAAKSSIGINMSVSIAALLAVVILQYLNHSKLRAMLVNRAITHTLAARFQLEQNIQLTKLIAPSAVLEFFTFLPTQLFNLLIVVGLDLSYETKTILIQSNYFWKVCFCTAYPLVAFARNAHLRRALLRMLPSGVKRCLTRSVGDAQNGVGPAPGVVGAITPGTGSPDAGGTGLDTRTVMVGWNKSPAIMLRGQQRLAHAHFEMLEQMWKKPKKS